MLRETPANIIDIHRRYSAILILAALQAFTSSIVISCLVMISINVGILMTDSLYYIVSKPAILSLKLTLLSSML